MNAIFNSLYFQFSKKMEVHSAKIMRLMLAIVYIWFGALKVCGMSPARELVEQTVYWYRPEVFIPILGICEVIIGLGLFIRKFIPYTIVLLLLHMAATVLPIFTLKNICFDVYPYCPTLVGQYIIKNLVLVSGALVVAGKYDNRCSREMAAVEK